MKKYIVLFELSIEQKVYRYYMVATEETTISDIEKFCRKHDHFGTTQVTISELDESITDELIPNLESLNFYGNKIINHK